MDIPNFKTKKELLKFIYDNQNFLITEKKAYKKLSDSFKFSVHIEQKKVSNNKEIAVQNTNPDELNVKVIINTTNLMDSHNDVHMPGLWNKSLKENKMLLLLQEHELKLSKVIADSEDLKAYVKNFSWSEIGYPYAGNTEALVFEATIKRKRNPYMFDQYKDGYIKNHSVGMRYVKLILAINNEDYGAEYDAWEKYYPEIANKEYADEEGYFWVVKEAKVIEGSAVILGSNFATPTLEVSSKNMIEPHECTQVKNIEPPLNGTLDYDYLINNLKIN